MQENITVASLLGLDASYFLLNCSSDISPKAVGNSPTIIKIKTYFLYPSDKAVAKAVTLRLPDLHEKIISESSPGFSALQSLENSVGVKSLRAFFKSFTEIQKSQEFAIPSIFCTLKLSLAYMVCEYYLGVSQFH